MKLNLEKKVLFGTVKDFTSHWATNYYLYNKRPILNNFRTANPLAILRSVYLRKKKTMTSSKITKAKVLLICTMKKDMNLSFHDISPNILDIYVPVSQVFIKLLKPKQ